VGLSGVFDAGVVRNMVREERCVIVVGGGVWLVEAELLTDSRNRKDCS